jgi:XTP/dITP diphosphohydrolase
MKIGKPLTEMTLQEMDERWNEAKRQERNTPCEANES